MPDFGFTSTPADPASADAGRVLISRIGPMPEDGTLDSISVFMKAPNANWGETIGLLYADTAGAPGALLARTAAFFSAPDDTPAWRTAAPQSSFALVAGAYYWIGAQSEHDAMSFYIGDSAGAEVRTIYSGTFGTPPNPFGTAEGNNTDVALGAYLTYSGADGPSGSGASVEGADTSSGTGTLLNRGLRTEVIYEPNTDAVVANATGVRAIVRSAIGGTILFDSASQTITGGVCTIDNDLVGVIGSNVDLELRWTAGGQTRFICAAMTVINLDA